MRTIASSISVLALACALPACGGSDASAPGMSSGVPFGSAGVENDTPQQPATAAATPGEPPITPEPAGGTTSPAPAAEGTPNVQAINPEPPPGMMMGTPVAGNGLLVGGTCYALCASDATDAQNGVSDGWGYENDASCIVSGGIASAQGTPCDRQSAAPLPPAAQPGDNVTRPAGTDSTGFYVSGGRLFDARGNDFVIRGINNPLAWFQDRNTGAYEWLDEIATTGANTVRLVWEVRQTNTTLLRDAIRHTIDLKMVPMVELHDVTGGTTADGPSRMAHYYADTPAVRQMLLDFEDYLLVNIANEWSGANDIYVSSYSAAIQVLRDAGINHTLVLDGNGYGQNANTVITQGQTLLAADPQHNLLFSTHMYESFRSADMVRTTMQRAADAQIPWIVGEFGFQHGSDQQGNPIQIPIDVIAQEAENHGFGYMPWSWTGNGGGDQALDLTARSGRADQLSAWGNNIINGANGIRASAKPASIFDAP